MKVSTAISLALLINLSTAWICGGIVLFELYRPSEGTLSWWSPWCSSTGVGDVPVPGFPSSHLGYIRLIIILIIIRSFTIAIRPVPQGQMSKQCVVKHNNQSINFKMQDTQNDTQYK